jgi:hypothetical protein
MTTLRAVQTEALDVTLPGLETVGTVLSRRSNIYGFPRFFVACFLVLSPMIAMSQDHKEHYSPQVVVYEGDAVLGQLVDGAGWKTTINLVNLDTQQASFKLYFFADRGTSLTLPIVNESGQTSYFGSGNLSGFADSSGNWRRPRAKVAHKLDARRTAKTRPTLESTVVCLRSSSKPPQATHAIERRHDLGMLTPFSPLVHFQMA